MSPRHDRAAVSATWGAIASHTFEAKRRVGQEADYRSRRGKVAIEGDAGFNYQPATAELRHHRLAGGRRRSSGNSARRRRLATMNLLEPIRHQPDYPLQFDLNRRDIDAAAGRAIRHQCKAAGSTLPRNLPYPLPKVNPGRRADHHAGADLDSVTDPRPGATSLIP